MTGDGTQSNPYTVASVADFAELNGKSGYVVMTADIDFNSAGGRENFSSVVCSDSIYFDGQGHIIRNFYQKTSGDGGLFKNFKGTFKNCRVLDAYILSTGFICYVGIISNYITTGSAFSDVTITGIIDAVNESCNTGGFAGTAENNIEFTDCKSVLNIQASQYAGGFLGNFYYSANGKNVIFKNCVSACRIYRGKTVGGYIGEAYTNDKFTFDNCISQCYFRGAKTQSGFTNATSSAYATFINCASICTMTRAEYAYGIAYSINNCIQSYSKCIFDSCKKTFGIGNGTINQSYAACTLKNVPEGAENYGLIRDGSIYISYYDSDIFAATEGGTYGAATTEQLKSAEWLREKGWAI